MGHKRRRISLSRAHWAECASIVVMTAERLGENRLRECETTQFYSQLFMTSCIIALGAPQLAVRGAGRPGAPARRLYPGNRLQFCPSDTDQSVTALPGPAGLSPLRKVYPRCAPCRLCARCA